MNSTFDPDTFMNQTVDAPMATTFRVCPEGEFPAMIGDFTREAFDKVDFTYKKGAKAGQPGSMTKFTCPFIIQDGTVLALLEREQVVVSAQIILDFEDTGGLSTAADKNVLLGRLRAAVNQNNGPWSFDMLKGAGPVMVKVKHRTDPNNTERKFAEVTNVSPIR